MNRIFGIFLVLKLLLISSTAGVTVGGIVDADTNEDNSLLRHVFQFSAEYLNNIGQNEVEELSTSVAKIQYGDEFQASRTVCNLLKGELAAMFGPSSPDTATQVQSICDEKEIPLILTTWNKNIEKPYVSLYPHPEAVSEALGDIIEAWGWESFTILYESAQWLPRVENLLQMYDARGPTITVRQLNVEGGDLNYRPILKQVKESEDKNILIDCSLEVLQEVLKQAQQVGILTEAHQFIITNLDMHTLDLEPYQYSGTNITGIRLIDPEDGIVKSVTLFWAESLKNYLNEENGRDSEDGDAEIGNDPSEMHNIDQSRLEYQQEPDLGDTDDTDDEEEEEIEIPGMFQADKMPTSTALIYDGLLLFAEAFKQFKDFINEKPTTLDCNDPDSAWAGGFSLANYIRTSTVRGLTKFVKFDHEGFRREFELNIFEVGYAGLERVGTWNNTHRLLIERPVKPLLKRNNGSMKNVSLIVLTAISDPYAMLKEESTALTGNDCFEGYAIDLIDSLGEMLGFNYTFQLQEDKAYGNLDSNTKQWNGMIREILEGRADLAIVDLTITADREKAVDFTMPFMNLGISILYQKPVKQPPSFFTFMLPFSMDVWMLLGAAYFGVSISLFVLGRISPNEWDNPYPCIEEPEELENQFTFSNAMWFTIGALLQQGTELAPKTPSTRTVASIWWFFTLIMVSSYTANLAAFLTVENNPQLIENVKQLAENGKIDYGAKRGGSTLAFFKESKDPIYQQMYEYMTTNSHLLTNDNDEGRQRVQDGNGSYAFLMESVSIDYMVERNCELQKIGNNLDEKGYGIAMKKEFPYRGILSESVLQLQEQGVLTEMQTKWWKEKRGGGLCAKTTSSDAKELDMANVGGIFYVVCVGSLVASLIGFIEWVLGIWYRAKSDKLSFKNELIDELKFVIKLQGNTKIVRPPKSASCDSRESATSGRSFTSRTSITSGRNCRHDTGLRRRENGHGEEP